MTDSNPKRSTPQPNEEGPKRWWTALGGTVLFVVLGVAFAPGVLRRAPAPAPDATVVDEPTPAARAPAPSASPAPELPRDPEQRPFDQAFDCMVQPSEIVEIGSAVTGLIQELQVERGDYVEAGQILATLESSVEESAVRVAQARADAGVELAASQTRLELGKRRSSRAQQLFDSDSLSLDLREGVETDAKLAALELDRARLNRDLASFEHDQAVAVLERRTIRSPISGFVIDRLMSAGEVVDEETLLRVAQVDPLRVEVILPSRFFGQVRSGDRAEVIPEAPLDQARPATVSIADPVIDGASGTFGVRLLLPNPDREIPSGLRCVVRFLEESS